MLIRGKSSDGSDKSKKKKKKHEFQGGDKEYFMDLPRDIFATEDGARLHNAMRGNTIDVHAHGKE